jgi:hypothetical protein
MVDVLNTTDTGTGNQSISTDEIAEVIKRPNLSRNNKQTSSISPLLLLNALSWSRSRSYIVAPESPDHNHQHVNVFVASTELKPKEYLKELEEIAQLHLGNALRPFGSTSAKSCPTSSLRR